MLKSIFGNGTVEKILFYVLTYGRGYAGRIAAVFNAPVNGIQQQLARLENGGVLVSTKYGRVRLYEFNPRYPFIAELKALLTQAMKFLPDVPPRSVTNGALKKQMRYELKLKEISCHRFTNQHKGSISRGKNHRSCTLKIQ